MKIGIVYCLLFCFNLAICQSPTDVIMTVGGKDVTVQEFQYIYEKNNGAKADYSESSINEYLDLYTKFKLKVEKARAMRLDTISQLEEELNGYRTQLANSFLTDREVIDKLIQEVTDRKKEDVLVSHILIKFNPNGAAMEKELARKKLINIKQQLREGKSFNELVKSYSEDKNSLEKNGELGYITANLPSGFYNLENAAYNMAVGEVSEPIASKLGYHLVKVLDKRPARGTVEVAHIFKKVDKNDRSNIEKIKTSMDSVYQALNNGAKFEELARIYSEDKTTKDKGGKIPAFGIGVYDIEFENVAFGLENDGDISRPILSSAGYHILKRIKKPSLPTFEEMKLVLKDKLIKMDRYQDAQDKMIMKVKENASYTENQRAYEQFVASLDEEFYSYKWKPKSDLPNTTIFSFGPGFEETVMSFALFAKKQTRLRSQFDKQKPLAEAAKIVYDEFVASKAFEYEQKNLENKYPEFRSLMREYEEGILLFEATKINVWDKANQDTLGLYNFYESNKSAYVYEQRATIGKYIINTDDKKLIDKVMKCAKKNDITATRKKFSKYGEDFIEYEELKVEPGSKELLGLEFKKRTVSPPVIDNKNKKSSFKKVIDLEASRLKTLQEARGYVVADYQDELEKNWVSSLKKEFPISINKSVLKALIK